MYQSKDKYFNTAVNVSLRFLNNKRLNKFGY